MVRKATGSRAHRAASLNEASTGSALDPEAAAIAAAATDTTPDRHAFSVVAVWPNGHGVHRWATARELHGVAGYWDRGGATVVLGYLGELATPVTDSYPEGGRELPAPKVK